MSGRSVLVTGGAAGIGWAAARRFAAAGDSVTLADRDGAAARARAAELGPGHGAVHADVSREDDVRAMVAAAAERTGRLDVLVNNAGVIDAQATPMVEQTAEAFRGLLAVNLTGAWMAAREAASMMLPQGGGAIVNLSSGAASVAVPLRNAYGASKAAVTRLTRELAVEWAAAGVRVNAVSPGYTRTELLQRLIDAGKVDVAAVARRIPLGRLAEPGEIAEAIFHLADARAAFTTGVVLEVDGGYLAFGGAGAASSATAPPPRDGGTRTVVVAGAGGEVGAAVARHFSARGARVAVLSGDGAAASALAASLPGEAVALEADLVDEAAVDRLIARTVERWGPIDLLVNGAGRLASSQPTLLRAREAFEEAIDAGLVGAFIVSKAVARDMLREGGGAIVNLASTPGLGTPPDAGVAAALGGRLALTRACACEWAAAGVRVNAVVAAPMETRGLVAEAVARRSPLGRLGKPEEVAAAIGFLASPAASYVNGAILNVDGGASAAAEGGGEGWTPVAEEEPHPLS